MAGIGEIMTAALAPTFCDLEIFQLLCEAFLLLSLFQKSSLQDWGGGDRDQGAQPGRLTLVMIAKLRSGHHWTAIP
jgi:hypothetical protein